MPDDFVIPPAPRNELFWLEPLGPQHNDADYRAWTTSMEHIGATPGFKDWGWPHPMSLEENLGDLTMHARHFEQRQGFTYTVRAVGDDDVVGCVYIYPDREDASVDATVRSWVRASRAEWDGPLAELVNSWLKEAWPWQTIVYHGRPDL